MTIQTLKQKLYEQKNKVGLVGGTVEIEEFDKMENYVSASISPENWKIKVSVKKGFNPIQDDRQKAYARAKKIENGLEILIMHVGGLHEPAHWELPVDSEKGCPYNVYWHDKILEGIKRGLPKNKQSFAGYVANVFEDVIINPRCREFNKDFSGQVLFWDWEGIRCKEEGKEHYTPFYEAFVKLNMHLFGDNKDKALLKRHYANSSNVDEAVKKTIKDLSFKENSPDTSYLFRRNSWQSMAEKFAKNLSDLLDEIPKERLSAFSQDSESQEGQGEDGEKPSPAGNGIEQKMRTEEGKEEIAYGRYSNKEGLSPNLTSYEQLDSLYRRLARDIPVEVKAMTREQGLQIAPLNYRPFDEEKDDLSRMKTSKIFFTDQGMRFGHANQPLTVTSKSKMQKKSFPNFKMIILDNSGSMKNAPDGSNNVGSTSSIPWGDESKYHYALLGYYGIENFLQRQGIAQYIKHGISLFSSGTRYAEGDFQNSASVRKKALSPDWGSTYIDAGTLKQALNGRESFVLSISDGAINNWSSEKNEFRELVKNNYFAHIQIGGATDFTHDLESWNIPVSYVNSGKDLSHLMVKTTKDCYGRFTTQ
ncbi:MAG: hypothetical protein AABY15_00720 [Nanoarchaeota archaeon]